MNACAMIERCSQRQVRAVLANPYSALANGCIKSYPSDVVDMGRWFSLWRIQDGGFQGNLVTVKEECHMLTKEPRVAYVTVG